MTDQGKKTFKIDEKSWSGYNQKIFTDRLQYFREVCSPEKSFNSEATIKQYLADVKKIQ